MLGCTEEHRFEMQSWEGGWRKRRGTREITRAAGSNCWPRDQKERKKEREMEETGQKRNRHWEKRERERARTDLTSAMGTPSGGRQ